MNEEKYCEGKWEVFAQCFESTGCGHFACGFGFTDDVGDFGVGELIPDAHDNDVASFFWKYLDNF